MRSVNDAAEIPLPLRLRNSLRGCKYISFVGKRHACPVSLRKSTLNVDSQVWNFQLLRGSKREKVGLWGAKRKLYLFRRSLNPMILLFNTRRGLLYC